MTDPAAVAKRLKDAFARIHETRMQDVPILNDALSVETVGLQPWDEDFLGVLITPWFINLVLFPGSAARAEALARAKLRDTLKHAFPAGRFSFILGDEDGLGRFQMCSLFSPVLEFENQDAARLAAEAALSALLEPEDDNNGQTAADNPDRHMYGLAKGRLANPASLAMVAAAEAVRTEEAELAEEAARRADAPRPPAEVSRRGLLTGHRNEPERPG